MSKPIEVTDLRGHALLRYVMELIEGEVGDITDAEADATQRGGRWNQWLWGQFEVPDGVELEQVQGFLALPEGVAATCGTAMCFAGHTIAAAGARPVFVDCERPTHEMGMFGVLINEDVEAVSTAASRLLGLNLREADRLFNENNSLSDVRSIVAKILRVGVDRTMDTDEVDR